jgi:hypothetical protein
MKLDYDDNVVFLKAKLEEEMSKLDETQLEAYRRDAIHSIMRDAREEIIDVKTGTYLIDVVYPGFYSQPMKFRNNYLGNGLAVRFLLWLNP